MSEDSKPTSKPALHCKELHRSFSIGPSQLDVLRGVSLELLPGQVASLQGASGSGKSTLLHILGLLDSPDRGTLEISGKPTQALGQAQLARLRAEHIGFVFQQFQLLPELSALENVLIPRRLATGLSWFSQRNQEKKRALEVLEQVGLSNRLRHRPSQLSGGEQQRVAVARALVSRPSLLLADEPTGNLDSSTGAEILDLLLALAKQNNAAVMLATHNETIAQRCNLSWNLQDGVLLDS
ncbi:MAG: ABC transporter ATP-binding protein [Planctomycetota bacterium]|jgi:ABC-type lipoprotein export system ATPase subunit|nr:ABC transporter ATP-binding protein [Planctomycetota bacterium]MDP6942241.1 ABC transporter ATP-binding protein [Planctomycetota bacterium]